MVVPASRARGHRRRRRGRCAVRRDARRQRQAPLQARAWRRAGAAAARCTLPVEGSFELNHGRGPGQRRRPAPARRAARPAGLEPRAADLPGRRPTAACATPACSRGGPYDAPEDIVTTEVKVKSHDGALVPMSIIHREGRRARRPQPDAAVRLRQLRHHRGAVLQPEPARLAGRRRRVRGGQPARQRRVYGQDWYKGGFQATKPNTWKDFIACAEWLIAQKWTAPAQARHPAAAAPAASWSAAR